MYPAITEHRIPYDVDGSEVGYRYMPNDNDLTSSNLFNSGPSSWLDTTSKSNLNKHSRVQTWRMSQYQAQGFWFFFPELKEVTALGFLFGNRKDVDPPAEFRIYGSTNTTNGIDGDWESAVFTKPTFTSATDFWRDEIFAVSFSSPVIAIKIGFVGVENIWDKNYDICNIHIYGRAAAGEQDDDIIFTTAGGVTLTGLMDFGDQPEGTTEIQSFKLKNTSTTKSANNVNLQLNHNDFSMSLSESGPWGSLIDISSIGAESSSATIYIKNALNPPLLTLGPDGARVIVTVGSWS